MTPPEGRLALWLAVLISGCAGLTWEVLWQHHAALALGISAFGAAVTLAALMAGLGLGALFAARLARAGRIERPLRAYGIAELIVGASGMGVAPGLGWIARAETVLYASSPALAGAAQVLGIALVLLLPSAAMGATLPLLAPWARRTGTSLPVIYALNTAGAVVGTLIATFVLLPRYGVRATSLVAACVDVAVGVWACANAQLLVNDAAERRQSWPASHALFLAFGSALSIFVLEVSWFRSIRAAHQATTETFAVLIAAFLVALALGSWIAPRLRTHFPAALPLILALAAFAVLYVTPFIDQLDRNTTGDSASWRAPFVRFADVLRLTLVPATLLGLPFPWLLAEHATTTGSGRLYAVNTLGAVTGALLGGFVLLPWIGASTTSFGVGCALSLLAVTFARRALVAAGLLAIGATGLLVGLLHHDGGARARVQGFESYDFGRVEFVSEGPDSTVWVAPVRLGGQRALVIDGFQASGQGPGTTYMSFMGHLPALATPVLERALVICFGTGQTAHAVRLHGPRELMIVDVNPAVFRAAPLFTKNERVLDDPRVRHVVMDGRAYLRRNPKARFDMITLEPMPPNHAGVNNLYSVEFYESVRAHLREAGTAAQWLPVHLIAPEDMRAIVAAFVQVFPHARLWLDPEGTGILVGGMRPWTLRRSAVPLPATPNDVGSYFVLDAPGLRAVAAGREPVTDDNQRLSYGLDRLSRSAGRGRFWSRKLAQENTRILLDVPR